MRTIFETPRLFVRELTVDDLDFVAAMIGDAEVMRFWPRPYTREESLEWIGRQLDRYQRYGYGYWLALDRASGEPVGQIGLLPQEVEGTMEPGLGYMIHHPFWNRGLALEGAAATRRHAFEVFDKPRVIALIRPGNIPSLRVAWKLGLKPEKLVMYSGSEHLLLAMRKE